MADRTRINQLIREKEVRLIDQNENHLGVMDVRQALTMAEAAGFDLVEVATKTRPHVCRIMDYGQFKYEQSKRAKDAKKKQKQVVVKEIKLRPRTHDHDFDFKFRHAAQFLEHGYKVRIVCVFRGRENAHKEVGRSKMDKMITDLSGVGVPDYPVRTEGRAMVTVLSPTAEAMKRAASKEKEKEVAQAKDEARSREEIPSDEDGEDQAVQV
jgi:translation initiation factor IF-3